MSVKVVDAALRLSHEPLSDAAVFVSTNTFTE